MRTLPYFWGVQFNPLLTWYGKWLSWGLRSSLTTECSCFITLGYMRVLTCCVTTSMLRNLSMSHVPHLQAGDHNDHQHTGSLWAWKEWTKHLPWPSASHTAHSLEAALSSLWLLSPKQRGWSKSRMKTEQIALRDGTRPEGVVLPSESPGLNIRLQGFILTKHQPDNHRCEKCLNIHEPTLCTTGC
jgi:hypothetical protein